MDMHDVNRNLREALINSMEGARNVTMFAVARQVCVPNHRLPNGIDPSRWHVVEVAHRGETMLLARATHDDSFNGFYVVDERIQLAGINMMGDVNMPMTWIASSSTLTPEQRIENWMTAAGHAQLLNNERLPQVVGWEGAAKLAMPAASLQKKNDAPEAEPSYTAQSLADEILAREAVGIEKYGTTVDENPLPTFAWLQHGIEEALDLAMYLRRAQQDARDAAAAVAMLCDVLCHHDGVSINLHERNYDEVQISNAQSALDTLRELFPTKG